MGGGGDWWCRLGGGRWKDGMGCIESGCLEGGGSGVVWCDLEYYIWWS